MQVELTQIEASIIINCLITERDAIVERHSEYVDRVNAKAEATEADFDEGVQIVSELRLVCQVASKIIPLLPFGRTKRRLKKTFTEDSRIIQDTFDELEITTSIEIHEPTTLN